MTTAKLERWSAAVRQFFFSGFRPLGPGVQVFFLVWTLCGLGWRGFSVQGLGIRLRAQSVLNMYFWHLHAFVRKGSELFDPRFQSGKPCQEAQHQKQMVVPIKGGPQYTSLISPSCSALSNVWWLLLKYKPRITLLGSAVDRLRDSVPPPNI